MTKKSILVIFVIATVLAVSCSVSKSAKTQRGLINGVWILNSISYEGNTGNFKSVLFNDAEDICFEGSEWSFLNNNSTGKYTIKNSSLCLGGDRLIRWSVYESENQLSQLQFKYIDEKKKDISGAGYRLNITNLTEQYMTLKSNVSVDGEPISVVYSFTKK